VTINIAGRAIAVSGAVVNKVVKIGTPFSAEDREMVAPRALTSNERELLLSLLGHASFDGARELAAQVPEARVTGGLPTFLDLDVPRAASASVFKTGPIPVKGFVYSPEGEVEGEVLVWVEDGYLSGIENAWYTDEAPSEMPALNRVRLE